MSAQATLFQHRPFVMFLIRMVVPSVVVFFVACFLMGIVAQNESVRSSTPEFKGVPSVQLPKVSLASTPVQAAREQMLLFTTAATHIPEVCMVGAYNDYQARQCQLFWKQLAIAGGVAAAPFLVVLLFLWLAWDNLKLVYRRGSRKIERGEALTTGIVTKPAQAAGSLFSYFHCVRSVRVQANQQQFTAFMSYEGPLPSPGTQVAIFDAGKLFGRTRYFAIVYAPHVAVVRGSRSD